MNRSKKYCLISLVERTGCLGGIKTRAQWTIQLLNLIDLVICQIRQFVLITHTCTMIQLIKL